MSEKICKVDKSLIDAIIHEKLGDIFGFSVKRTDNKQDAEDLTQDILTQVYHSFTKIKSYEGREALEGWIWAIARHTYCNFLNRKKKNTVVYIEGAACNDENLYADINITDNFIKEEELNSLRKEIGLLSKNYRDIVVLYYLENKTSSEIANILGLTLNTVKWRLHEAKRIIKEGMGNMTTYSERSYAPSNLWVNSSGIFNADHSCYYIYDQLKSLLRQNIAFSCYREPLSIPEISVELGVPRAYIEEDVETLAEEEILKLVGSGRYQTDFVIITREIKEKIYPILEKAGGQLSEIFIELIKKLEKDVRTIKFIGADKPLEELLWVIVPYCVYSLKVMQIDVEMPLRPHGNKWIIVGFEGLKKEYPWSSSINRANSLKDSFCQTIFWTNTLTLRAGHMKEKECIFYRDCALGKKDMLKLTEEEEEIAAKLIKKGFLIKTKEKLSLNMITFNDEQYEEFKRIIDKSIENFDDHIVKEAYELIIAELETWIPNGLRKKDLLPYAALLVQDIAGYMVKDLLEKDIIRMPDKLEISVKGMYAVIKNTEISGYISEIKQQNMF